MIIHVGKMTHLVNKDFAELAADSSNYLTWAMYVKIMLITKTTSIQLKSQIHKPFVSDEAKYTTLHFLRCHLYLDLKNEYMMEENPRAFWVALNECYDQQKAVILPEARREWSLLHLMDIKSIAKYNSVVHKICFKLRFGDYWHSLA